MNLSPSAWTGMAASLLFAGMSAGCCSARGDESPAWCLPFDGELVEVVGLVFVDPKDPQTLLMDVEEVGGRPVTSCRLEAMMSRVDRRPELMNAVKETPGGRRMKVIGSHCFSIEGLARDPSGLLGEDARNLIGSERSKWWHRMRVYEWEILAR